MVIRQGTPPIKRHGKYCFVLRFRHLLIVYLFVRKRCCVTESVWTRALRHASGCKLIVHGRLKYTLVAAPSKT